MFYNYNNFNIKIHIFLIMNYLLIKNFKCFYKIVKTHFTGFAIDIVLKEAILLLSVKSSCLIFILDLIRFDLNIFVMTAFVARMSVKFSMMFFLFSI